MVNERVIAKIQERIREPSLRVDYPSSGERRAFPPVNAESIEEAEDALKFSLPGLLAAAYREVGNGGFGPGYGMLGLKGGQTDDEGRNVVDLYAYYRTWNWPERVLPLWDWGDSARSCLDCSSEEGRIFTQDESGIVTTPFSLAVWFEMWASGVDLLERIFEIEEGSVLDPFTKQPTVIRKRGRAIGQSLPL